MLLSQDNIERNNTLDPAYASNQLEITEEKRKIEIQEEEKEKSRKQREMKITDKQWKIFYYMLEKSKEIDNQFMVDKRHFNISKCCKILDIKSNQTFYLALSVLEEKKLIEGNEDFWIIKSENKMNIDIDIISLLINYSIRINKENNIDLLRIFYLFSVFYKDEELVFTFNDILSNLGYEDNENMREYLIIYFSIIEFFGLGNFIEFEKEGETYFKLTDLKTHLERS